MMAAWSGYYKNAIIRFNLGASGECWSRPKVYDPNEDVEMKTIVRAAFAASLLYTAAGTATLLAPTAAYAEDKITPDVGKPLSEAIKAAHANDFQTALAKVKEAQAVADRTPFDDYKINSILAFIAINMKDNDTATTASEAAADSPAMPDAEKKSTFYNAVLFAAQAKHYQKAITYGQQLAALNGLDATTEAVLAQVYYFTQDYPHAQQYAQMSIDASKAVGTPPNGTALDIIMSSQAKQNNQAGDQEMLENLAVKFNKDDSWSQLVDIALSTKGIEDPDALFLFRLKMLVPNAMHGDDYTLLAGVADQQGYPTEAYAALQKGIASGKLTTGEVGESLAKSRNGASLDERSLSTVAAQAERTNTGEQDIKLAEDYWGYGRYTDAEAAARRAMGKDGLKDPSEGPMLIGMLLVAQGKYDEAIQTLGQVSGTTARGKTAHLWTIYAQAQKKQAPKAPASATTH